MHHVVCAFCRAGQPVHNAIEAGWLPSYWDHVKQAEISEPVCPECTERHLLYTLEGFELRPLLLTLEPEDRALDDEIDGCLYLDEQHSDWCRHRLPR